MNDAMLLACCCVVAVTFCLLGAVAATDQWPIGGPRGTVVVIAGCAAACTVLAFARSGIFQALPAVFALACAVVCAATDLESGYVYDRVTYPSAVAIGITACAGGTVGGAVAGAAIAASAIVTLWIATMGRGVGLGDAKLAAIIGAGLGPLLALPAVGLAFVFGAAAACCALAARRLSRHSTLPFAPYLAAAFAVILIVKELQA